MAIAKKMAAMLIPPLDILYESCDSSIPFVINENVVEPE